MYCVVDPWYDNVIFLDKGFVQILDRSLRYKLSTPTHSIIYILYCQGNQHLSYSFPLISTLLLCIVYQTCCHFILHILDFPDLFEMIRE